MTQRGGKRPGAGRPKGARDKATREQGATLGEMARAHTAAALKTLAAIAKSGESEAARVSAANALLDRGYGRPPQSLELSGPDGEPIALDLSMLSPDEKRALAKVKIAGE